MFNHIENFRSVHEFSKEIRTKNYCLYSKLTHFISANQQFVSKINLSELKTKSSSNGIFSLLFLVFQFRYYIGAPCSALYYSFHWLKLLGPWVISLDVGCPWAAGLRSLCSCSLFSYFLAKFLISFSTLGILRSLWRSTFLTYHGFFFSFFRF